MPIKLLKKLPLFFLFMPTLLLADSAAAFDDKENPEILHSLLEVLHPLSSDLQEDIDMEEDLKGEISLSQNFKADSGEIYFFIPPKNWIPKEDISLSPYPTVGFQSPESKSKFSPSIVFRVYPCQNASAFIEQTKKDLEKDRNRRCYFLTKTPTKIGTAQVLQTEETGNSRGNVTILQSFVFANQKMLTLTVTSLTDALPSLYSDIVQSFQSLDILKEAPLSLLEESKKAPLTHEIQAMITSLDKHKFLSEEDVLKFFKPEFEKLLSLLEKEGGNLGSYFIFLAMQQIKEELLEKWHAIS